MATVHIVCGPPCAGKSTYVAEHAEPDDVVLDWDGIVTDLGFPPRHHHVDKSLLPVVMDEWRRRLADATAGDGVVWVIRAKPRREVQSLARSLKADVMEITAPLPVLLERAAARPHPAEHRRLILAWHRRRGLRTQ
ncbi:AAA family ATPase [Microbacterium karelineae]|uniref:AAA family ATPase n=1 Tax=Microbacterium karelineae TaxID=2654283 RepID=UPI0012EA6E1D|nr:AAA family ATPase [Microbacterium karelineae]